MSQRITEPEIRALVFTFYERVRNDEALGPVFEARLEGRWDPHLEKMCDFWSSILLGTGRFLGDPVGVHSRIAEINPALFDHWIELFRRTAFETLPTELARDVADRSVRIRLALERATEQTQLSTPVRLSDG